MSLTLLEKLSIPTVTQSAIPVGFEALTTPILLESEGSIVESMWTNLKGIAAIGVVSDGPAGYQIEFYRSQLKRAAKYEKVKGKPRPPRIETGTRLATGN